MVRDSEKKEHKKEPKEKVVIQEVEINLSLINDKINILDSKLNYLINSLVSSADKNN